MHAHVQLQVDRLDEGAIAYLAFVLFEVHVDSHVCLEVARLAESLA